MSAWPPPAYPPQPRRSRSRSPSAHNRPSYSSRMSYSESTQYPPTSEREWPDYGRTREWDEFDRDRSGWDQSRGQPRGRSRSPAFDDERRKRRRSPSPYERGDRFEPRPRYADDFDAHSRSHGHSPSRRSYPSYYPSPQSSRGRHLADPYSLDAPATFKQFAEWFRYTYPTQTTEDDIADKIAQDKEEGKPKMMRVRYDKYKKTFHCMQVQTLFDHHRKAPWFQERYDPAPQFVNLRKRVRKQGWEGKLEKFRLDLEEGVYDPVVTDLESAGPASAVTASGAAAAASLSSDVQNGENGNLNPPPSAATDDVKNEDDGFALDAEEDAGDNDSVKNEQNGKLYDSSKKSLRSDEVTVLPEGNQVMIRTIPPDIGRVKLEEVLNNYPSFMYLALGEPLQKRNYYRAGWIRFRDDADMDKIIAELGEKKIDGFRMHLTHSTRPFASRLKTAPEIVSKPERIEKDLASARALAALLETEAAAVRNFKEDAMDTSGTANGEGGEHQNGNGSSDDITMDEPAPKPSTSNDDDAQTERGSEAVERRIDKIVSELQRSGELESDEKFNAKKNEIALDLYIEYLRAAFNTCFYCAAVVDHIEELQRKCVKHVRKPLSRKREDAPQQTGDDGEREKEGGNYYRRAEKQEKNDEVWLEKFDMKLAVLLDKSSVDPRDYGGKNVDEELKKAVEPHIKQEDEGKYRCRTCNKLFKATTFVEKHIANKHPELVKQLDDLTIFNNFALDPQRIQPYTRPPVPTGNGQAPPPQAYGLQGHVVPPPDFGRPPFGFGYQPYPMYGNPYADQYQNAYSSYQAPTPYPPPRGRSPPHRRHSDRNNSLPTGVEGLPAKPVGASTEPTSNPRRGRGGGGGGPPPPPPPDAKEDPRAAAGKKVSYHDMDEVAEGDVELMY